MSYNRNENRETVADIVAQIRAAAYIQNADTPKSVLRFADRIEAAAKREREAVEADALYVGGIVEAARHRPSNAAAMREALVWLRENGFRTPSGGWMCITLKMTKKDGKPFSVEVPPYAEDVIDAALSAPPRNCDVGTVEEQNRRFDNFCRGKDCKTCPCNVMPRCHMVWAQMPYEAEEGGKE